MVRNVTSSSTTINITENNSNVDLGGFAIFDSFVEGWKKANQYFSISLHKIESSWPVSGSFFRDNYWILWPNLIKIRQDARWERDVILHEYGHYINAEYGLINGFGGTHSWGDNLSGLLTGSGTNTYSRNEAVRCALNEGWATFFSIACQYAETHDSYYDAYTERSSSLHDPLEENDFQGADNEAATCGIFWDVFDPLNSSEGFDNVTESLTEIWRILRSGSRIDSIQQFADKWQNLNKGQLTQLSAIYSHFGINLATLLTVNGSAVSGNINTVGKAEWYYFVTTQSGSHVIETHGGVDTYMYLYQSDKTTEITRDDDGGVSGCSKVTWALASSTTYYVKVMGYSGGAVGAYTIDVKGPGAATFNPPRSLAATAGDRQVSLSWSVPSTKPMLGDEPPEKRAEIERLGLSNDPLYKVVSTKADGVESTLGLSGYKVYRSTSQNGTYTVIASPTSTSYTDGSLTNGTTYWYYATAVYTSPSGESGASNTVSGIPTSGGGTNLALNKAVVVSSSYSASYGGEKAVDGSASTYWRSGNGTAASHFEWIYVNLGARYNVNKVVVNWYSNYYASDFSIQTWNGSAWVTQRSNMAGSTGAQTINITSVGASSVAILCNTPNSTTYSYATSELEVYGTSGKPAEGTQSIAEPELPLKGNTLMNLINGQTAYHSLMQNYPNPFNPSTSIEFAVPQDGYYSLKVFNIFGQEVADLVDGELRTGTYSARFDGNQLASGIYICKLRGNGIGIAKRMLLLK